MQYTSRAAVGVQCRRVDEKILLEFFGQNSGTARSPPVGRHVTRIRMSRARPRCRMGSRDSNRKQNPLVRCLGCRYGWSTTRGRLTPEPDLHAERLTSINRRSGQPLAANHTPTEGRGGWGRHITGGGGLAALLWRVVWRLEI